MRIFTIILRSGQSSWSPVDAENIFVMFAFHSKNVLSGHIINIQGMLKCFIEIVQIEQHYHFTFIVTVK